MGWTDLDKIQTTLADVMSATIRDDNINIKDVILHHNEDVDLIPSNLDLSQLEVGLVNVMSRESVTRNTLSKYKDKYDYILIDCMPSLGMITINALACADKAIIPVQTQFLAAKRYGTIFTNTDSYTLFAREVMENGKERNKNAFTKDFTR